MMESWDSDEEGRGFDEHMRSIGESEEEFKRFGEKDWQSVAACMECRLGSQCMSRWTQVLHPDRHRRGRWLAEEDTRLKWTVSVYGPRGWKNIAPHVPGHSDVQCRERWGNLLDPSVKIHEWIPEEDAKLEELVVKYGRHRWAAVGAELGRKDNQCFRHWKLSHPEHKISFKKDMVITRAALSTNFVGRENDRPDLGFQDFLPPSGVGEECDRRALPPRRPNTSKEKVSPELRMRPSEKRKSPEPCSEVNENQVVKVYSRRRRAPQPGARASQERKTPHLPPEVIENHDDTAGSSRDEKDAPLIVYTRRNDRFSSGCGKSTLDNTEALELNAVGLEMKYQVPDKGKEEMGLA